MLRIKKLSTGDFLCLLIIAALAVILAACSSEEPSVLEPVIERPTEPPEINQATVFEGPLVNAGQTSVSRYIKNGIYSAVFNNANRYSEEVAEPTTNLDSSDSGFSTTNTQEVGVDEADRIEYDGSFLYLTANAEWTEEGQEESRVRVLERQDDFSLSEVASLPLTNELDNIDGIYQHNDRLAVLSSNFQYYAIDILFAEPASWEQTEQRVGLDIYDTSLPSSPTLITNIQIEGAILSSRRIDDHLYIVTSYTANVEGLNPQATTEEELLANYLTILDTPNSELMPKIYRNTDEGTPLGSMENCSIPAEATENDGYAKMLNIIRINLSDANEVDVSCISAVAEMMYMSTDNLYLSASLDNQTVLHKIALDEELSYQATGAVPGYLGWRGAANLRLSEYEDNLRIVSTDYSDTDPVHKLSILAQQESELVAISTLPNETESTPIGKPGEDIYAVRFFGDRGYIVTFERIDPLYVLDLANPTSPQILGELEIPGFSSYLHPLDNGYLIGVGQQINTANLPEDDVATDEPIVQEGMKVSLFDVSDPSSPNEVGSIVKPYAYTPVEYDYRALSVLNSNGSYQLALPIESWQAWGDELSSFWRYQHSLLLLEIDTNIALPELIIRQEMIPTSSEYYYFGGNDRSVIHGDNVYYIHGNQVWQGLWEEGTDVFGPY